MERPVYPAFFVMWEFETGYIGLFLSAFFAATILPVASEVVLLAMLAYYIGYLGNPIWLKKIGVSLEKIEEWSTRVQKYGIWLALFSWLPVVGDLIGVALGFFRSPKLMTFVFFAIGKFIRYSIVILLYFLL
jgi:membrane protein YqaA with SNARE-associated domain